MQYLNFSPREFVQNWRDAADKGHKATTNERTELYEKTKTVATTLVTSKAAKQDAEVNKFCRDLIKEFETLRPEEREKLADWIAENSSSQKKGAYESIHNLFDTIVKLQGPDKDSALAKMDSGILTAIEESHNQTVSLPSELKRELFNQMSAKQLVAMRLNSSDDRALADAILMEKLNNGAFIPKNLGLTKVTNLIEFFGDKCSQITRLNLEDFQDVSNNDIKKLSDSFTALNHLSIKKGNITDAAGEYFAKMTELTSFELWSCKSIFHLSFLKHCKMLTELNLPWCNVDDFLFLKDCPNLTSLNLKGYQESFYVGLDEDEQFGLDLLKHCPKLTSLNLSNSRIFDLNFLENSPQLTTLNLTECENIDDFNGLMFCPELKTLNLTRCVQIKDINFLEHCKGLVNLDLTGCYQFTNLKPMENCTNLTSLSLSWCNNIKDFNPLINCMKLTTLDVSECIFYDRTLLNNLPNLAVLKLGNSSSFLLDKEFIEGMRSRGVDLK